MPRSRRRRKNDRRREVEQRRIAAEALLKPKEAEGKMGRYVKAVFRPHAGEVLETPDGRSYEVEDDGSLERFHDFGKGTSAMLHGAEAICSVGKQNL